MVLEKNCIALKFIIEQLVHRIHGSGQIVVRQLQRNEADGASYLDYRDAQSVVASG